LVTIKVHSKRAEKLLLLDPVNEVIVAEVPVRRGQECRVREGLIVIEVSRDGEFETAHLPPIMTGTLDRLRQSIKSHKGFN